MSAKPFYSRFANQHRLFYADWSNTVRQEGAWLDALLGPQGVRTVLDCTCGIGTQAIGLALHGYEVTGSDLSPENLAQAQRGAQELGMASPRQSRRGVGSVTWHQADVRFLDNAALAGPFDAVISLGNSLPHLLTESDLLAALCQMNDHAARAGLVLVGQRDWDRIAQERPHFSFRHEHLDTPEPGQRTVLFDLWHYEEPLVTFEVFFLQERNRRWQVKADSLRYRMWRRHELVELMQEAGIHEIHTVDHPWELRLVGRRS